MLVQQGQIRGLMLSRHQLSFLLNTQDTSAAHTASHSIDAAALCQQQCVQGMRPTTHRHLVPRLRRIAAIPSFPLRTFRACKGTTLLLILYVVTLEWIPHQVDWQWSIYQLLVDLLQWPKLLSTAVACMRHSTICPDYGTAHLQYSHYGLWHSAVTISNSSS